MLAQVPGGRIPDDRVDVSESLYTCLFCELFAESGCVLWALLLCRFNVVWLAPWRGLFLAAVFCLRCRLLFALVPGCCSACASVTVLHKRNSFSKALHPGCPPCTTLSGTFHIL